MSDITKFINKIICGNAIDIMKKIPDESVNLIVTSPHITSKILQEMG